MARDAARDGAGTVKPTEGRFEEGYNVSIPSALLLQAYLAYVIDAARADFASGSRTKDELNQLFK